jgi:hypothetical protein
MRLGSLRLLPQRPGSNVLFAIVVSAAALSAVCFISWAGVRKQPSEMLSTKQSAAIPAAKLRSIMKTFRSTIQSQMNAMEGKVEAMINAKRMAGKDDTSAKNSLRSELKSLNSRQMLKQENDELFAWDAALQHQILMACVSAAVSKESVASTKSVHEIKEDCLKQVMGSVEHAIKKPTTKSGA